jgi:hypothetical protein
MVVLGLLNNSADITDIPPTHGFFKRLTQGHDFEIH